MFIKSRKWLSVILTLALVLTCIPAMAWATEGDGDNPSAENPVVGENDLNVIRGGQFDNKPIDVENKTITITVPYSYQGTVDVTSLKLNYASQVSGKVIEDCNMSWGTGADAVEVDTNDTAEGTVTYSIQGADGSYTSEYTVEIERAAGVSPSVSGSISKTVVAGATVNFSGSDFTGRYSRNDGNDIGRIVITGSDSTGGTIKVGETAYDTGNDILSSNLANLSYESKNAGTVQYSVYFYENTTDELVGSVSMKITVTHPTFSDVNGGNVNQGETKAFPVAALNTSFKTASSSAKDFDKVEFESLPDSSKGILYKGYKSASDKGTAVKAGEEYQYSGLSEMTFVAGTTGGTAKYEVLVYDDNGGVYEGSINFTVEEKELSVISKSVDVNDTFTIPYSEMSTKFRSKTGKDLYQVSFTNSSSVSKGSLYYGSSKITNNTSKYNYSNLSSVTFQPSSTGSTTINYRAYDSSGNYYDGSISLSITGSLSDLTAIKYSVNQDSSKTFSLSDFTSVLSKKTSRNLNYVKFTLPSTSRGVLYYDYTSSSKYDSKVSSSTKYYRTGSSNKLISKVTFVPKSSYSGSFDIEYTAYDADGYSYDGKIRMTVNSTNSGDLDVISYSTEKNKEKTFATKDFKDVLEKESSESLDYVKFELPSSSYGVLYYDYTSSSKYDSKVSASTKYYRTGSTKKLISDVCFVPKTDYTGTVKIKYTAYDADGEDFSGEIRIAVGVDESADLENIKYTVDSGSYKKFALKDFKNVLEEETSRDLDYIKFKLPSSSYGTLYYNYTSSKDYDSAVSAGTKYYASGSSSTKLISKVAIVPKSSYNGTFNIEYTAYDESGNDYSGIIKVTVGKGDVSLGQITYTVNSTTPISLSAADFNSKFSSQVGENFDCIQFKNLPSGSYGSLQYNYVDSQNMGSPVVLNDFYYRTESGSSKGVDKIKFVPNNKTGSFEITYNAYTKDNVSYEGTIKFVINTGVTSGLPGKGLFKDVTADYSWAANQIEYLYEKGIVSGTGTDARGMIYSPANKITRGDFMLMLYRAFKLSGNKNDNFPDVPKDSYYYEAIAVAKSLGIASGAYGKFDPTGDLTRQDAMALISRAIDKTNKKNVKKNKDVSKFKDKSKIADYAQESVGTLVGAGVIKGYEDGTFNPEGKLTRAEMAIVLYNVEML